MGEVFIFQQCLNQRRREKLLYVIERGLTRLADVSIHGLAPGVMVDQREALAITTGLTDTVYFGLHYREFKPSTLHRGP